MEKIILEVEGMSCHHCVNSIKKAVSVLSGVSDISVDLTGKTVMVKYDPAFITLDIIKNEIEEQGFEVAK